jgi:hypothetical protein
MEVFMIEVRPFAELGGANHGWLKAKHHFSFANYYDPKRMSWGPLRVWNAAAEADALLWSRRSRNAAHCKSLIQHFPVSKKELPL